MRVLIEKAGMAMERMGRMKTLLTHHKSLAEKLAPIGYEDATGFHFGQAISEEFPAPGQRIKRRRQSRIRTAKMAAEDSPEAASNGILAAGGPDFDISNACHSASEQGRPKNRASGPRFHSAPLHRFKSPKAGGAGAVSA